MTKYEIKIKLESDILLKYILCKSVWIPRKNTNRINGSKYS